MTCTCGKHLPDPVISLDPVVFTPPITCDHCGVVHRFSVPNDDDILLTQFLVAPHDRNMANGVQKPFGDRSECPVCNEMMKSPVIKDGKSTTESCDNCGTRRTIQVDGKPAEPDPAGKLWN